MMECCLCGVMIDYDEAKWVDDDVMCEDCYVFERGYV